MPPYAALLKRKGDFIEMNDENETIQKNKSGTIVTPQGFYATGLHSGVKKRRKDLGVLYCEKPANVAAVYTLNQIKAAPLDVTKESIQAEQKIQAIIVNSGNANACTGEKGLQDAYKLREVTATKFQIPEHFTAVASTGIIGLDMPMDKIVPHIGELKVSQTETDAANFGESILTTDTFSKSACFQTEINGKKVTVAGAAKGSGMIEPNMGTMLGFITTDAVIEANMLDLALKEVVNQTFNCITVDGDTSTNDMVIVLASELAENDTLTPNHPEWEKFIGLLQYVSESLAKDIAFDGEGATKLIEVNVTGAESDEAANKIAKSVVGSSLVKTAVFGTDLNWGRVIAAVGYSGEKINPHTIDMKIGSVQLLKNSEPTAFSEEDAKAQLQNDEIGISIHLHMGNGTGKAWGCDLTYDYVRINASYRS